MKPWKFLVLLLVVAGFAFGVVRLFQLRLGQGDVYPPSSSLRSDPLGAKVFYESLREMNSVSAKRLYQPLRNAGSGKDKTLFVLGIKSSALTWVDRQEAEEIKQFVLEGGRLVISFAPVNSQGWLAQRDEKREASEKKEREERAEKAKSKKKLLPDDDGFPIVSLEEQLQFNVTFEDLELDEAGIAVPVSVMRSAGFDSLPEVLPWHSAIYFNKLGGDWKTVYSRNEENAVVIERTLGKGSIVISADSYLFSNEAMRKERQTELLAWFIGPSQTVLFDETHFGIQADPGIVALIRQYRLHGLVAGLFLLAGLFVWQNAVSFVPPHDDDLFEGRSAVAAGKESSAGFINLLRRNIQTSELLATCFAEWKKSGAHQREKTFGKFEKIESLVRDEAARPNRERNPVQSYREISTLLTEKK